MGTEVPGCPFETSDGVWDYYPETLPGDSARRKFPKKTKGRPPLARERPEKLGVHLVRWVPVSRIPLCPKAPDVCGERNAIQLVLRTTRTSNDWYFELLIV